jgi:hypothetical protein
MTTLGYPVPLHTSRATPSSALFLKTTVTQSPEVRPIRTDSALDQEQSSTITNALVAQRLKRRDRMLCFSFSFSYFLIYNALAAH